VEAHGEAISVKSKTGVFSRRAFLATAASGGRLRPAGQSTKPEYILRSGAQFLRVKLSGASYSLEFGLRDGSIETVLANAPHPLQILRFSRSRIQSIFKVPLNQVRRHRAGKLILTGKGADESGSLWHAEASVSAVKPGFVLECKVRLLSGSAEGISLRVGLTPLCPPDRSWSFAPGLLYGGNRADYIVPLPYPPRLSLAQVGELELEKYEKRVTADLPRVDQSSGYRLDALSVDATAPEFGLWDTSRMAGFFFGSSWATPAGLTGLSYVANPETGRHEIAYTAPGVRERKYRHCKFIDSGDQGAKLGTDDSLSLNCSLLCVAAKTIPAFIHEYRLARARHRTGESVRSVLSLSEAWVRTERLDNTVFWQEKSGYYRCEGKEEPGRLEMGWVDGMMRVYSLLHSNNALSRQRALSTLQFILDSGQAPTGLFWGRYASGQWLPAAERVDGLNFSARLPSHTTDTVHWGFKVLSFLERAGNETSRAESLQNALLRAVEALQAVWKQNGDLGWMLDPATGRILWRGSANGALAVANFAEASVRFKRRDFLDTAQAVAAKYYEKYVQRGVTYGGPGDALLALDSESCSDLVEGFVTLYETTKNPLHLRWAVHAAELLSTWVFSANVTYPPGSRFERLGIQPLGSVMANQQNLVGTPGLCTDSGVSLLRLYRHTKDAFFLELLADIVRACPQMVVRDTAAWGNMPEGGMTECLSMNDSMANFGDAYRGTAIWPPTALKLAYLELPGIYVEPAANRVFVLDHVDAKLDGAFLKVHNPTAYSAEVKIQVGERRPEVLTIAVGRTVIYPVAPKREDGNAQQKSANTRKESQASKP
jgi:hypothetical protein